MSFPRDHEQDFDDVLPDEDLDDGDEASFEPESELSQIDPIASEEPFDDEEEFSLNQLSQAYAKVLKGADSSAKINSESAGTGEADETTRRTDDPAASSTASTRSRNHATAQSSSAPLTEQDAKDNAGCPVTPASIVEAMLFVGAPAEVKLTSKKIASYLRDVTPKEIKSIVDQLNGRYEKEQAVYRIKFIDGAWRMELEDTMHSFQDSFQRKNRGVKLNASTVEVLAIVAYNQPVTRNQIESIRKRPSGAFLNQLVRRELVAELPGLSKSESAKYVTTDKFLAFFHLAELKDLPQSHEVEDLDELLS